MNYFKGVFVKVTWNKGHLKVTCVMISKKMRQNAVVNVWAVKSFNLILKLKEVYSLEFVYSFLTVPAK